MHTRFNHPPPPHRRTHVHKSQPPTTATQKNACTWESDASQVESRRERFTAEMDTLKQKCETARQRRCRHDRSPKIRQNRRCFCAVLVSLVELAANVELHTHVVVGHGDKLVLRPACSSTGLYRLAVAGHRFVHLSVPCVPVVHRGTKRMVVACVRWCSCINTTLWPRINFRLSGQAKLCRKEMTARDATVMQERFWGGREPVPNTTLLSISIFCIDF
jgi:hypothetical protein